jgi:hypothetical protein
MVDEVSESDVENLSRVESAREAFIEIAEVNIMNTMFAYSPRRCIKRYSRRRVNKTYNFVLESKQTVQNISLSEEKIILFGTMC